jgi:hypothetical protein
MSIGNSNYPSLGTHTSDGFRSGSILSGTNVISTSSIEANGVINTPCGYEIGGANGVMSTPRYTYTIKPLPASSSALFAIAAIPASGYLSLVANLTYVTPIRDATGTTLYKLDVPRNIAFNFSAAPVVTITIWGYDYGGYPITEQITTGIATSYFTVNAFMSVRAIFFSAGTGPITVSVGTGNGFGLPYYIFDTGCVDAYFAGAQISNAVPNTIIVGNSSDFPALITTTDARGLINVTPNGLQFLTVNMFVFGAQSSAQIAYQANYFGLVPVSGSPLTSVFANPFRARYGITPYSMPLI